MDDITKTPRGEEAAARGRVNPKSPREAITPEPAPPPPKSRRVRNPVVVALNAVLTLLMIAVIGVGGLLYWGKSEFDRPGPLAEERVVMIPVASGLQIIADTLEREGVIEDRYVFMGGVTAYRQSRRLKAGEYAFAPGMSMRDVMDLLVSGKAILHSFTVPEGLTSQQIVDRLMAETLLTGQIDAVPAEGTLLPETYRFTRGTTRQQILDQMKDAHTKVLEAVWSRMEPGSVITSPEELVTLASIVEKETGRADERPRVAAVFLNRLEQGMRLQSDPTIIYGIAGGAGTLGRPIRRSDIDTTTPYNTYRIDGLPPGPIANPGRAALEAVSDPSSTEELYFVADGTGGHVFARTLEEHNRNVAKWRRIERERTAAGNPSVDQRAPEAIDGPEETAVEPVAAAAGDPDPNDLLDGMPPRDPDEPVLPRPKPQG